MEFFYTLFLGLLIGIIMADVKKRFGVETFWIGIGIVAFLSFGAVISYRNIL